jgi:PAS domain S-box-containing protein
MIENPTYEELEKRILELKKIEKNLCKSKDKYSQLFQNSKTAFTFHRIITDDQGRPVDDKIIEVNDALEAMIGFKKDEINGKTIQKLFPKWSEKFYQNSQYLMQYEKGAHSNKAIQIEEYSKQLQRWYLIRTFCSQKDQFVTSFDDITAQKKIEHRLKESERKLSTLIGNLPGIAYRCLCDHNWTMIYLSEGCQELTGYKPAELISNRIASFNDLIVPQDRQYVWDKVQDSVDENRSFTVEYRILDRKGTQKWVQAKGISFQEEDNGLLILEGFINDISDQKQSEAELKKSEATLRGIFDVMHSGVILVDASGKIIFSNMRMVEMFGHSIKNIMGSEYAKLTHGSESSEARGKMFQLINGKIDLVSLERLYQRKDGSTFPGHLSGRCLTYPDGTFWALVGVITDITERKKTEEALIQSETRHRTLVDTIPDLVWLKDQSGVFLSCNNTFERFFGAKESEIIGKTDYDFVDKDLANFFRDHDRKAMAVDQSSINEEWLTFADTGYHGLFETIKTPMRDAEGNLVGVLGIARDISEHKKTENALLLSQQKLTLHRQQTPLAVLELDLNFRIQAWNPSAEKIFGYTVKEIIGKHISVIVPKEDWGYIKVFFTELLQKKGGERKTNRNINKKGDVLFCEWFNTPIVDETGKMIAVVLLGQDITQRRQTEKALRINEERYRELFDNMTSGVAVYTVKDAGNTFLFKDYNQSAELITGVKRDKVLGKDAVKVFPGLLEAGIIDGFRKVYHTGKATHLPAVLYQDDQLSLWVEHYIYKLPSGEIVSVLNDISDKKQTEEKLQVERDKLRSVINGMGDSLYIINKNYRIEFQNNLFREQFGDLVGRYKTIFQLENPCDFCLTPDSLNENCIKHVETDTINKKRYEMNFSPFQEAQEERKIVVVMRDITEKKILQAEAMRAGHLASLGELAAGVAHEINNPVTGIISIAEVLADKFEQLGGDKKIPERIIHEGERISRIVKNLLSFARVKKENHSLIRINEILKMSLDLVEKQIFKDSIHLSVNISPDIPKIKANDQEIQQVFLNIISNARYSVNEKYPDTSEHKKLEIMTEIIDANKKSYVRISFFDSGMGINENCLNLITDPFFSTKPQGEGTGLGLSISHGIIKNHGGRLLFNSVEGEYTMVFVDLPVNLN